MQRGSHRASNVEGREGIREGWLRAAIEESLVAPIDGILVSLGDHRRGGALEDGLQEVIVLA